MLIFLRWTQTVVLLILACLIGLAVELEHPEAGDAVKGAFAAGGVLWFAGVVFGVWLWWPDRPSDLK